MSFLQTMLSHIDQRSTEQPSSQENQKSAEIFPYVATDLNLIELDQSTATSVDVDHNGKTYRRLDPQYLAWLRSRMVAAQAAHRSSKLSTSAWENLRSKYNPILKHAIKKFGNRTLQNMFMEFDPKSYQPPRNMEKAKKLHKRTWIYPEGDWSYMEPVSYEALAKVNAIRDEAISKGWSETKLYQNRGRYRFPFGQDYGLICYVDGKKKIGAIAPQHIEIIHNPESSRQKVLKFYNPCVPQPWTSKEGSNVS